MVLRLAISNIDLLIESFTNACIPVASPKVTVVKTTSLSSLNTSLVMSKICCSHYFLPLAFNFAFLLKSLK